jgi:hypothetical protein
MITVTLQIAIPPNICIKYISFIHLESSSKLSFPYLFSIIKVLLMYVLLLNYKENVLNYLG